MSTLIGFGIDDFYTFEQLQEITLEELKAKPTTPTRSQWYSGELKLEGMLEQRTLISIIFHQFRLWLVPTSKEGEQVNYKVTLEIFDRDNVVGRAYIHEWVPKN